MHTGSGSIGLERLTHSIYKVSPRMTIHALEHDSDIEDKDDPIHLTDLRTVLLEENWVFDRSSPNLQGDMAFRKNGTDYDRIVIRHLQDQEHSGPFMVTVPLPSGPGAYRTRVATTLDVYLYVTAFIEYYAETTLSRLYWIYR
jgi:hypothetical protein